MKEAPASEFTTSIDGSIADGSFVRVSLTGYEGAEPDLKKITARLVSIKGMDKISFTYSYRTRDIIKNYPLPEAIKKIYEALSNGFTRATLLDTGYDLSYPSLKKTKPSHKVNPPKNHDQAKNRHVETSGKQYLHMLDITDERGRVYKNAQDKYRQIDKYIEILGGLIPANNAAPVIADMGAGKGYLTFALYDFLREKGMNPAITGVEYRQDLVDQCNKISQQSGFSGLSFKQGTVEAYDAAGTDILIALHACDTATDDAIAKGIAAGAGLIVVAPCCHKQIRREIKSGKRKNDLDFLLKYGTLLERQAEMVTDAMRGLLLEHAGYSVKLFEFISDAHTPKNVMIVAQKTGRPNAQALEKFKAAKEFFGIGIHHLEKSLMPKT